MFDEFMNIFLSLTIFLCSHHFHDCVNRIIHVAWLSHKNGHTREILFSYFKYNQVEGVRIPNEEASGTKKENRSTVGVSFVRLNVCFVEGQSAFVTRFPTYRKIGPYSMCLV